MKRVFGNVKNSKLISGPKFAFHSPHLDNSECVFSAVLPDRHTYKNFERKTKFTNSTNLDRIHVY